MRIHESLQSQWTEESGQTKWALLVLAVLIIGLAAVPLLARMKSPKTEAVAETAPHTAPPATIPPAAVPQNGGFEEGGATPAGWYKGQNVDGVTYLYSKEAAHGGSASIGFTKTAQRYFPIASWNQSIHLDKPARSVMVTGWVWAQQAYKAVIDVEWSGGHKWASYIGAKNDGDPPANHGWQVYTGTVNFGAPQSDFVLGLQMYGPGTVLFDDVSVSVTE